MAAFGESGHSLHQANFYTTSHVSQAETNLWAGHPQAMLTEIYIEALLVDIDHFFLALRLGKPLLA